MIMKEGTQKLHDIEQGLLKQIAIELQGEDIFLFLRAVSPGKFF